MKKLLTLVLTLALCLPMVLTTSIEANASNTNELYTLVVREPGIEEPYCYEQFDGTNGSLYCGATITYDVTTNEAQISVSDLMGCFNLDYRIYTGRLLDAGTGQVVSGMINIKPGQEVSFVLESFCAHENMEEVYAYTVGEENEGHMTLVVCKSCDYVNPVPNSKEPHEFNTSGYCGKCGYDPNAAAGNGSSGESGSTGGSNSTISGNNIPKPSAPTVTPSTPAPAPTAAEIHAQKAAQVEAKQKKVVTTASGEVVKTAIAGVYEVSSLSGTAVNTPKAEVQKAIGLSDEEVAAGTNASIYMSDFVSKEDRAALNNAAASVGKNVLSMIVSDMYSITKDGKITKLHSSKEPVSLMFGLPKYAVDANRTYSMICVTADGKVVELKDTDNDPSTLTVDTTVFGKYVIVY